MSTAKLVNGNCLDALRKLPDRSVDLIITDPPYNLGNFMRARATNLKQMRENFFGDAGWDDMEYEEWVRHMDEFFAQAQRVLKKGGSMIVFMSVIKVETLIKLAEKNRLYYKTTGIWHKTNPMPRNMNLHFINSIESWVYFTNITRTGTFNNDGKAIHDYIESSVAPKSEKLYGGHPTQKPESVIRHFVKLLSNPGDTIMDPFMGSGTTGVAAIEEGRNFIGIDLQPEYVYICERRLMDVEKVMDVEIEKEVIKNA